jgi:hypothetical protein
MNDNAFATKRFTRNAAQQAVKQTLYKLSDFWKQNTPCNAAKNDQAARYAFPSAANSRNKILAITLAFDPPSVVVLLLRSVLTVANPSRHVLYGPLTVRPWKSIINSCQTAKSLSIHAI